MGQRRRLRESVDVNLAPKTEVNFIAAGIYRLGLLNHSLERPTESGTRGSLRGGQFCGLKPHTEGIKAFHTLHAL